MRTASVEVQQAKSCVREAMGEELLILIVHKLFDEFKMKWRRESRLHLERKERPREMFSKTEASKSCCIMRGKSKQSVRLRRRVRERLCVATKDVRNWNRTGSLGHVNRVWKTEQR